MDDQTSFSGRIVSVCPKTGRPIRRHSPKKWAVWLLPITGLAAFVWFLIRVLPKPSRAEYPCQRVAKPLAAGFAVWTLGLVGSNEAYRRLGRGLYRFRFAIGVACLALAAPLLYQPISIFLFKPARTAAFVPADAANAPIGVAKGLHPGRVVWVYDSALCDTKGSAGFWWEDRRTDPVVARRMMSRAIIDLTGIPDPASSWEALFRSFNRSRGGMDVGYRTGERIAIKINNIFSRTYAWPDGQTNRPSPQMLHALLWQLVKVAGVRAEDITVYDCIFYNGDPVYAYCRKDFPGLRFAEGDATDRSGYEGGPGADPGERIKVVADPDARIYYGDPRLVADSGLACLPTVVSRARYLINISLPRPHELAGVSLCAKNLFGSVWHPNGWPYYHGWDPSIMHASVAAYDFAGGIKARPMGTYNALVDLMGHKDLGGKTLLFFSECIRNKFWSAFPFNGGLTSSLFASQDGVAIDSVLVDFLRSEGAVPSGSVDNYLHEAALADKPPSGTLYDPENDGTALQSLGTHEHWNNPTDRRYSRNLGRGKGIELIQSISGQVGR